MCPFVTAGPFRTAAARPGWATRRTWTRRRWPSSPGSRPTGWPPPPSRNDSEAITCPNKMEIKHKMLCIIPPLDVSVTWYRLVARAAHHLSCSVWAWWGNLFLWRRMMELPGGHHQDTGAAQTRGARQHLAGIIQCFVLMSNCAYLCFSFKASDGVGYCFPLLPDW